MLDTPGRASEALDRRRPKHRGRQQQAGAEDRAARRLIPTTRLRAITASQVGAGIRGKSRLPLAVLPIWNWCQARRSRAPCDRKAWLH